jgi:hypothetical protein
VDAAADALRAPLAALPGERAVTVEPLGPHARVLRVRGEGWEVAAVGGPDGELDVQLVGASDLGCVDAADPAAVVARTLVPLVRALDAGTVVVERRFDRRHRVRAATVTFTGEQPAGLPPSARLVVLRAARGPAWL